MGFDQKTPRPTIKFWTAVAAIAAIAQVLAAVPGALETAFRFLRIPSSDGAALVAGAIQMLRVLSFPCWFTVVAVVAYYLRRAYLDRLARKEVGPLNGAKTEVDATQQAELILCERPLLLMKLSEQADLMEMPEYQVDFGNRHPFFSFRRDYVEKLKNALMVGSEWPQKGYGRECLMKRLRWYHVKGIEVYLIHKIDDLPTADLEALHREAQAKARTRLR